ncbi:MAG: hypothetical protein R8N23_08985 [Reichenbachiella sp.]|uniref:hypothetical protein n=1 Tax=Reichenbachiella sp. TaxID=2184521 RepID=UPI0029662C38|nr:hypothetical protein [Reichenbachiella sp.]MDW3209989.1 hypothetical protein [Reichenbachiella sp.]
MKQLFYLLSISVLCISCSIFEDDEDGDSGIQLSIEFPQSINPGQLITIEILEPSKENFSFYISPNSIPSNAQILDADGNDISSGFSGSYPEMKTITFSVTEEGTYDLIMSIDDENWTSNISFSASGCLHITAEQFLSAGLTKRVLNGIDYCITEDITIPYGGAASINTDVIVQFGANAGLIVNGTLTLYEANLQTLNESGWKGILINDGGTVNIYSSTISEAGYSAFTDKEKAMIINDGTLSLDGSSMYTSAEGAYGVYFLDNEYNTNTGSTVSSITAEHAVYGGLDDFLSLNATLGGAGYSTIIGDGELTSIAGTGSNIFFGNGAKIHFEGSVQFGQSVNLQSNEITMEADQSLIFSGGMQSNSSSIKGKDGAKWKGVFLNGTNNNFNGMTIEDAGSDFINISGNPLLEKAAVFVVGHLTSFSDCTITGSGGYGLYISPTATRSSSISGDENTFDGNAQAAIVGPLDFIHALLHTGSSAKTTTFDNSAAESVEIWSQTNATAPTGGYKLPDLGADNYYLLYENLTFSASSNDGLTLEAGAHLKVNAARSMVFSSSNNGGLFVKGTSENPVIIEAADAVAGWNGIHMQSPHSVNLFNFDYLNISGGGAAQLPGTTGAANLIFDSSTMEFKMTNCQINNSKGYGIVIENGSNTVDHGDLNNNITFSGNASGNVLNQNI